MSNRQTDRQTDTHIHKHIHSDEFRADCRACTEPQTTKTVCKIEKKQLHLQETQVPESLADAKVSARQQCVYEGP